MLKLSAHIFYGYLRLTEKWLHSKKDPVVMTLFKQAEQEVKFAKELFKIWGDEASNGRLELGEVVLPMIATGLMRQKADIGKVMSALVEPGNAVGSKKQVTVLDFVKIFKANPFIDRTVESMKTLIKA